MDFLYRMTQSCAKFYFYDNRSIKPLPPHHLPIHDNVCSTLRYNKANSSLRAVQISSACDGEAVHTWRSSTT